MVTGNRLNTAVVGKAKVENLRVFTPTGKLNAAALDGDINIRAGNQLNLLAGGNLIAKSGGNVLIEAGGKITLATVDDLLIGLDTLADLLAVAGTTQTTIFYQDAEPTAIAAGDIWYDTDASPVTIKRWDGTSWTDITTVALAQALSAAGDAQSTADGKIVTFAQDAEPTAEATGDFWIDTDDNNKLYRWSGSAWVLFKTAAGYVATSKITIDDDAISIASGGSLTLTAPTTLSITAGATNATAIAIRNDTDYFISAGHLTQSSAPFYVKKDGTVKASAGLIGDFTLSSGQLTYSNSGEDNYASIGKWGIKLGAADGTTGLCPFEAFSHYQSIYGHLFTTNAIIGVAEFDMSQFIIKYGTVGSRVPKIKMTASNGWIQTKGSISIEGNFDCPSGVVVAGDWVDFTSGFKGESAVAELKGVKNNEKGDIDHTTLPQSARKKIKLHKKLGDDDRKGDEEVDGRSIGMMVSILTKAIQELDARLERVENGKKL